ncbi:MAG: prolyl oligopeptidase family serine peptidase, partial [Candidatus Sumerlaeia bacterium]|nr:prolyl oligopeptidase family serine peptidase [Candidatus Sumerlaeia bacterium]
GGCVASYLAGRASKELKAIVLWAPVASGKTVFEHIYNKRLTQHHYTLASRKPFVVDLEGFPVSSKFLRNLIRLKPVSQLKQLNCPVLICQGSADEIVPISQAEEYFHSLKRWNKQIQLYIINGATHSFNSLDHIKELLAKTTDWFRQHL